MRTLGDIMIGTKNNSLNGVYNRGFSLLGDPSLTLSYPKKKVSLTKINGIDVTAVADTIKALEVVTLEGEVQHASGSTYNSYSGQVHLTIFDKTSNNKTLGDETDSQGNPRIFNYSEQKSILFSGSATVNNGKFKISFVVPKDISYNLGYGKISMYANPNSGVEDANGYLNNIIIGGAAENTVINDTPPEIQLFMDDETFEDGSIVDVNSFFIAQIKDDNGINTAGTGIGHEIIAILDGDDKNPIILNNFYTSKIDDYKEGEVRYYYEHLSPGRHTITFKIWDTHNNSSTATITFNVASELNTYNFPNPFTDKTTFVIDQPFSGRNGTLEIHIINYMGETETVLSTVFDGETGTTQYVEWDGRNSSGGNLASGIYFYRTLLRYDSDGTTITKLDRLLKVE
jgi:hypothetical protein